MDVLRIIKSSEVGGGPASVECYSVVEFVMGMAVSYTIRGGHPREFSTAAVARANVWLHTVDGMFSSYRDDSLLTRYLRSEVPDVDVVDEFREVLDLCGEAVHATGGAFDPSVIVGTNGLRYDPSGLVKGWAVERAAAQMSSAGVSDFTINAGGDIAVRGGPWSTGIRHPFQPNALCAVLDLCGPAAIATSAEYERPGHVIDPQTGSAAQHLASVTVVGANLAVADLWATAVFAGGLDVVERLPNGYDAFIVTHESDALETTGMSRYHH